MAHPATLFGDIHCRILFTEDLTIDETWQHQLTNPFWRLYWNGAEGAAVAWPGGIQRMPRGRLVVVPAWGRFTGSCTARVRHVYLHADPMGLPSGWVRSHCQRPYVVPADPTRDRRLCELHAQPERDAVWRLRLQSLFMECLAELLATVPAAAREALGSGLPEPGPVAPALRYIEENLRKEIPTDVLAAWCGLSPDHFAKVFTARIGQSPARYVQERRVVVAAERLLASTADIGEIASDCGFANRFHFTRVFTRRMGQPPARYRQGGRR
jgi:AraC-like DNA-binding protein